MRLARSGILFQVVCLLCHVTLSQAFLPSDLFPDTHHLFLPVSEHHFDLIFGLNPPPLVLCSLCMMQFFSLVSEDLVLGANRTCFLSPQLERSWFSV